MLQVLNQYYRRPIGSPRNFRIPEGGELSKAVARPQRTKERRIYLGKILGYAKIIYSPSIAPVKDQDVSAELDKLYDQTSLHLYWNARAHYERRKKALLEYSHRGHAKEILEHGSNPC